MFHCVIRGPISSSGHIAPHVFPNALLTDSNFSISSSKGKGPQISHCVIKGLQFPHQNDDLEFPITLSRGPHSSLRHQGAPIVTSNFPSHYQGVPFSIASSRGPLFHPSGHQRDPNFQDTSWDMYWLKSTVFQSYNRDKRVQSLSRVYVGEGSKE